MLNLVFLGKITVFIFTLYKGKTMRKGIHPEYVLCKVTCVTSGKEIEVMSVKPELRIDISSFCHPFYTGSDKVVDTAGRVEKFKQRYNLK